MKTILHPDTSMSDSSNVFYSDLIDELKPTFEARASEYDSSEAFVDENYADLKKMGFFAAGIPESFGGGGLSHSQIADLIRRLGQCCSSTALAVSMHHHIVSTNVWKVLQGKGGEDFLSLVVEKQPTLVSTGGRDWLESNGETEKVEGGFRISAIKHFASQSASGDILVSSVPYLDPEDGWRVLHFSTPLDAEGVQVLQNWKAMGMRNTGSNTVKLDRLFVPESSIALNRPQSGFHPIYNAILAIAMPYIMGAYLGIAQQAASKAIAYVRKQEKPKAHKTASIGEMNNALTTAELNWKDMLRIANDLDFKPINQIGQYVLTRKTNVANACIRVVTLAMEIAGGQGYFRSFGLEKLFRDVQACKYHPLPEKDQQFFSGEHILAEK